MLVPTNFVLVVKGIVLPSITMESSPMIALLLSSVEWCSNSFIYVHDQFIGLRPLYDLRHFYINNGL